jgi:hypothetical protein
MARCKRIIREKWLLRNGIRLFATTGKGALELGAGGAEHRGLYEGRRRGRRGRWGAIGLAHLLVVVRTTERMGRVGVCTAQRYIIRCDIRLTRSRNRASRQN